VERYVSERSVRRAASVAAVWSSLVRAVNSASTLEIESHTGVDRCNSTADVSAKENMISQDISKHVLWGVVYVSGERRLRLDEMQCLTIAQEWRVVSGFQRSSEGQHRILRTEAL
jgi:hypothetical protein